MKKIALYSLTVLATLSLAACSQSNEKAKENKKSGDSQTTIVAPSIDYSKFDSILAEAKAKFDPDNLGLVNVGLESIANNDYPKGFNTVRILLSYDLAVWADQGFIAMNEGYATPEQHNLVTNYRIAVSELAKQLPDDLSSIELGYENAEGLFEVIANSTRTEDLIPVGELIQ